jgi:hypothetical protein
VYVIKRDDVNFWSSAENETTKEVKIDRIEIEEGSFIRQ